MGTPIVSIQRLGANESKVSWWKRRDFKSQAFIILFQIFLLYFPSIFLFHRFLSSLSLTFFFYVFWFIFPQNQLIHTQSNNHSGQTVIFQFFLTYFFFYLSLSSFSLIVFFRLVLSSFSFIFPGSSFPKINQSTLKQTTFRPKQSSHSQPFHIKMREDRPIYIAPYILF